MQFRLVSVILPKGKADVICKCFKDMQVSNWWRAPTGEDSDNAHLVAVVAMHDLQDLLDTVSEKLEGSQDWQLVTQAVEAVLPEPEQDEQEEDSEVQSSREEIFDDVRAGATITVDYLLMTALAVFVAAIGLNTGQVAVVIGAMVIAPLLGPILAFSFGTALGNLRLLRAAAKSLAAGLGLGIAIAIVLGFVIPVNLDGSMIRFDEPLGLNTAALPLASGAAAALMVARGETSALVGVMVAAALLPPVTAFGMLLGAGNYLEAGRAIATVMANIVAINLAAQIVFVWKGIRPRRWNTDERQTSLRLSLGLSAGIVAVTVAAILYFGGESFVSWAN